MKVKIYSIALVAVMSLVGRNTASAQTPIAPVAPVTPVAPVAPVPATTETRVYSSQAYSVAPQVYTVSPGYQVFSSYGGSQDTAYRTKMRKLQEKMRALNKEMSDLSREERTKATAASQERVAAMRKTMSFRLDSSMKRTFSRTMATNIRFNGDNADANLAKQVASGEVKEKTKTFTKSYAVDANDALKIDNSFGKVTINTWAKNEVKVDVDIKAYAIDDADAQKLIDKTTINASKENNTVAFETAIEREQNSWWGTSSENGKITKVRKVIINYVVYMPAKSALTINNKYGGISLPDLSGKLNISNSYGGLVAKALTNSDNNIEVRYGSANIESLANSDLKVSYGSLQLDQADNLNANISYSPAKIGRLSSSGTFVVRYGGGLEIGDVGKNLKALSINSSYAPIKLGSLNDANADFDVTVHNGDFLYDSATNVTSKTPDNERGYTSTKNYKGHVGKGNADKVITIKSTYSTVKFD
ncbi:hypothetical protein [Mucilaginibacter sp. UYCu711]|uniref:hypothetical protein n=1 Tax=Mucilaginibacter sp. UYCu711 TaxID=3156339 RepID=UPI003D226BFF